MFAYLTFISRHKAMLGFGFIAVFWGNFGQSFFIAWFGADIQSTLGITASVYGSAYSFATLLSALIVVWLGGLIDKVSLRTYSIAAVAGLAAACLILSLAQGLAGFLLGIFLLRLFGQSLLPHTGVTSMARYFTESRGKAISVAMTGVPSGEIVLPFLAVFLTGLVGWQNTFLLIGIAAVIVLMPVMWWLSGPSIFAATNHVKSEPLLEGVAVAGRRAVLKDYRFWLALPGLVANPFLITGIFIHQNFIVAAKDWTVSWLAICFVVYGISHWLSSLLAGALVDRYKGVRLLPFYLVPMLLGMLVLAFVPGWWTAMMLMSLLGMAAGCSPPVTGSMWAEIYGTRTLGAIRSMTMAIMVCATAASPVLFGYVLDAGTEVRTLFGFCALYVAVAIILMYFSYPSHPHRHALAAE